MKKWVIAAGAAWLLFVGVGLTLLAMRTRHVATADLPELYLVTGNTTTATMVQGSFGNGTTLARAEHLIDGEQTRLWIFAKPGLSQPSTFQIRLPLGVSKVLVENPDRTQTDMATKIQEPPAPMDSSTVVQMDSVPR